jgi:uncharacterized protein (DUF305 family)
MGLARLPKTRTLVLTILGVAVAIAAAFMLGRFTVPVAATPSTTSAEAGFSRDMQTHHLQAVQMSLIIRDNTEDPDIRLLAYDIATTQQQQAGQMAGWLTVWGLPQAASEPSMTWMTRPTLAGAGHNHGGDGASAHVPGGPMPGMATEEQLAELRSLTGVPAEKLFLELMIEHHKAGVEMAQAILDRTDDRAVTSLAQSMVKSQQSEIEYMNELLAARQ